MIQRVLNSKNFLAVLLALVTGTLLYVKMPWPMMASRIPQTWNEYFLRLVALRDLWTYAGLKASYHVMLLRRPTSAIRCCRPRSTFSRSDRDER